jgi:hypothetical protein
MSFEVHSAVEMLTAPNPAAEAFAACLLLLLLLTPRLLPSTHLVLLWQR